MPGELDAVARRVRRLEELRKGRYVERANNALHRVWEAGHRPTTIRLRRDLLSSGPQDPAPALTQLLRPRGVALRFYLLAVFEAQCRLTAGEKWTADGSPPLKGPHRSWADFVAVDGAFDQPGNAYMPATRVDRDIQTLRVQQIHGALRTLEALGPDDQRSLVEVPKTKSSSRSYAAFSLMQEGGRGDTQTPNLYTVPRARWNTTFTVPATFFLRGWIQVLQPSEVATWLILQWLAQTMPNKHTESGVYLYANTRNDYFRLRRDSYEDACNRLLEFGLVQYARPGTTVAADAESPSEPQSSSGLNAALAAAFLAPRTHGDSYEPDRYQVTDEGLAQDASEKCFKESLLRQKSLERRRELSTKASGATG
ncbi:hypothetical protein GCM10010289_76360 [Streptomyces violascens]|uniref:Uncharacterized protein n=1 Tax=Streptomyces violascens TaxID=67381 RepID=A0ABQ3QL61_9ACTN|nr:hypothetical protein GCM10010289_76360 [Streptomyces violascens]GHI38007.1 hypothetical protein Sviol_24150 [Streptomyces violascens]